MPSLLHTPDPSAAISAVDPYHRPVIHSATDRSAPSVVRLEPLPEVATARPIDTAESFRDLPGLALLESARPGRNARWTYLTADPVAILAEPAPGGDPFAVARRLLARLAPDAAVPRTAVADALAPAGRTRAVGSAPVPAPPTHSADVPPFLGGLVGYLAYELGDELERLPSPPPDDQGLPLLRLALHDWVIAWDRRTGGAWLAGRALDGDGPRLDRRLADVRARLRRTDRPARAVDAASDDLQFRSTLDRSAYEAGVETIRGRIARGDIYQANLTRRLETAFDGDPWPLYRRLRTGDPSLFSAYLDLGGGAPGHGSVGGSAPARPRAILSASPEPFLAVTRDGAISTDPIKGTRPRGRTRDEDRALAAELLASDKDRAENVMIVDVLRNDLGRVSIPGTVRVPRLCRLERTAAVQHLVSTVTGRLAPGRDAFDLLRAAFPGGSITGAPKIRAMETLRDLEPTRRGPYTGALGWIGPDGAMATSILIRTLVADGTRLTLHVGGGITWRSDPAAEWDETVAKARGPLGAIGGREVGSE